ncbi:MAG: DUF106 domain-containing protein [Candidatus Micrarchaeota archaeon]|nr:DUF106 domain-containing protein [Candidatus Micrarchaeota archaeon]
MFPISPILIGLICFAIAYSIFSVMMQRRLANMPRVSELQRNMKTKMDEYKTKAKGSASNDELSKIQSELGAISSELMKHQLKPMLVIFPVFIVVFYFFLPAIFPPQTAVTLFSYPLSYRSTFVVVAAVLGIALSSTLMLRDRRKYKKTAPAASSNA